MMVRMLQFSKYFFMTLAALCFASPAFAQATNAPAGPSYGSLAVGIGMGIAAGLCGLCRRSPRPQPRRAPRHSALPHPRPRLHRVPYPLHLRAAFHPHQLVRHSALTKGLRSRGGRSV